jgi:hypothetical protein
MATEKKVDLEGMSVSELQALIADAKEQKKAKRATSATKLRLATVAFGKHAEATVQAVKKLQVLTDAGFAVDWDSVNAQLDKLAPANVQETVRGMELVVRKRNRGKKVEVTAVEEAETAEPDSKPRREKVTA